MSEPSPLAHASARRKEEYFASLALRHCRGLGPVGLRVLLQSYGSALCAYEDPANWAEKGVQARSANELRAQKWRPQAEEEWRSVWQSGCGVLLWSDQAYPSWLREIPDAPIILYYRGDLSLLGNPGVAVVGARDCTLEGVRATVHIARGLSSAGVTVISGLARGIDRVAHLAALEGPGSTIAVCGTGLDVCYPKPNLDLRELILERGLILSELAPDQPGDARHFPVRNRIISGLARAVVVTEAALRSGSLNTARHATEQGREVFAVPGPVSHPSSRGCQELVRKGARPAFSADDVLREILPVLQDHVATAVGEREAADADTAPEPGFLPPGLLPWMPDASIPDEFPAPHPQPAPCRTVKRSATTRRSGLAAQKEQPDLTGERVDFLPEPAQPNELTDRILRCLGKEDAHPDEMARCLEMPTSVLGGLLASLEVEGAVRRLPGGVYTRRK